MRVLVTGSRGFIGKNLVVRLAELPGTESLHFNRDNSLAELRMLINQADAIVHLAGENRPKDVADFETHNTQLTTTLCSLIAETGRRIPLIVASSTQAALDNPYGKSKFAAELAVDGLASKTGNPVVLYRLPNVFGKWCRPNYNSVVATFCHNLVNDLPIQINDANVQLRLVYIDDVISEFLRALASMPSGLQRGVVTPEYLVRLGELADHLVSFKQGRSTLIVDRVGLGLPRALYSTYVSYMPPSHFGYDLTRHADERGEFVEMLKTHDCGQISYFTAHPGVTRGRHYHHSKTEKFLVIKGTARFNFRHVVTNETHHMTTTGHKPQIVETAPGWAHEITNVGQEEMIVMLWANELFDPNNPDTIAWKI